MESKEADFARRVEEGVKRCDSMRSAGWLKRGVLFVA
jgi:hypothetical protein